MNIDNSINSIGLYISQAFNASDFNYAFNLYSQCLYSILQAILKYNKNSKIKEYINSLIDNETNIHTIILYAIQMIKEVSIHHDVISRINHKSLLSEMNSIKTTDDIISFITLKKEWLYLNCNFRNFIVKILQLNINDINKNNQTIPSWIEIYNEILNNFNINGDNIYLINSIWYQQMRIIFLLYSQLNFVIFTNNENDTTNTRIEISNLKSQLQKLQKERDNWITEINQKTNIIEQLNKQNETLLKRKKAENENQIQDIFAKLQQNIDENHKIIQQLKLDKQELQHKLIEYTQINNDLDLKNKHLTQLSIENKHQVSLQIEDLQRRITDDKKIIENLKQSNVKQENEIQRKIRNEKKTILQENNFLKEKQNVLQQEINKLTDIKNNLYQDNSHLRVKCNEIEKQLHEIQKLNNAEAQTEILYWREKYNEIEKLNSKEKAEIQHNAETEIFYWQEKYNELEKFNSKEKAEIQHNTETEIHQWREKYNEIKNQQELNSQEKAEIQTQIKNLRERNYELESLLQNQKKNLLSLQNDNQKKENVIKQYVNQVKQLQNDIAIKNQNTQHDLLIPKLQKEISSLREYNTNIQAELQFARDTLQKNEKEMLQYYKKQSILYPTTNLLTPIILKAQEAYNLEYEKKVLENTISQLQLSIRNIHEKLYIFFKSGCIHRNLILRDLPTSEEFMDIRNALQDDTETMITSDDAEMMDLENVLKYIRYMEIIISFKYSETENFLETHNGFINALKSALHLEVGHFDSIIDAITNMQNDIHKYNEIIKYLTNIFNVCIRELKDIFRIIQGSSSSSQYESLTNLRETDVQLIPSENTTTEQWIEEYSTNIKDYREIILKICQYIKNVFIYLTQEEAKIAEQKRKIIDFLNESQSDKNMDIVDHVKSYIDKNKKEICNKICIDIYEKLMTIFNVRVQTESSVSIYYQNCDDIIQFYLNNITKIYKEKCKNNLDLYYNYFTSLRLEVDDNVDVFQETENEDERITHLYSYLKVKLSTYKSYINDVKASITEKEITLTDMINNVRLDEEDEEIL